MRALVVQRLIASYEGHSPLTHSAESARVAATPRDADSTILDSALDRLGRYGPESRQAGANHAPMVAEALCVLGRAQAVAPWIERYERRLELRDRGGAPLPRAAWRESLGKIERFPNWVALFESELAEKPWQDVINGWIPRLVRGTAAAAFHGLIRTAHAVRALSLGETPRRRHELAEGLAYWAARYMALRTAVGPTGGLAPSEALQRLRALPLSRLRRRLPNIASGLLLVSGFPRFRTVIHAVDVTGDSSRFISELTETSARYLLANEIASTASVAFLHSVTGPAALRLLVSHLRPPVAQEALRYCWQVVAALYMAFGPADSSLRHKVGTLGPDDLIDRAVELAVETSDPHAVKLVEACLREHRLNPSPVYLLAARRGIDLLRQHPT